MHVPTLTALEFPRIQQELASFAACQLGKELALAVQPLPSLTRVRQVQQETTEAKAILAGGRTMPFGGIQDVRLHVERAVVGGVLRPEQLTAVADTIYGCRQLHRFLTEHRASAPSLGRHAEAFGKFDEVEDEIRRCIEPGGVSSRASRNLKQIRSEMGVLEGRIQDRLNGLLRQYRQHLQDALVTTRNGRYVIPVKASSRAAVPGTVHGASSSGSTLFVEPAAVSQLCEELESWRAMEAAEVEQVLSTLSAQVADHAHSLKLTLSAVAELDLIFARARLSHAWDARPVAWNEEGLVDLKGARHPLLGRNAVGNHIRMTADTRMLIVTGPNTGGKTLLLKTLGLLVIVARCGLHIPVDEGSSICYFDSVFADIGDHQSLEQSLSTFSGHIASVAPMLTQAGPTTLILLDELGSGTDPHEGTGLGVALLEAFLQRGAYTLSTTHLREIKEFGRVTPGCAFAGMGFDGETLRPTYRLLYGTLGESHGLEIAARAGLPAAVVERARQLVYGNGGRSSENVVPVYHETLAPVPAEHAAAEPGPVVQPVGAPGVIPVSSTDERPAWTGLTMVMAPVSASRCRVWYEGAERELTVRDHLKRVLPGGLTVGDRVRVRDGQVAEVAKRQTVLVSRDADTMAESVVAANVTRLLILQSVRQPDFHETVVARHLLYAERQGIAPIVCLTKSDLAPAAAVEACLKPFRTAGYTVVAVSATRNRGMEALRALLDGQVTAVMGTAGTGKTTVLAALAGDGETVVEDRGPGHKEPLAYCLSPETWLLDMPGLRELGVWKPDLAGGFGEFGPFVGRCNRPGCLHRAEPGCAVRQAVQDGHVQPRRYQQYLQLLHYMRLA